MSDHTVKATMMIRKPINEVFNAFIDPAITSNFWFSKGSGKLVEQGNFIWSWEYYNISVPLKVESIIENEEIIIHWGSEENAATVKWNFKPLSPSKTFVTITNYNFACPSDRLIAELMDSTGGFTIVLAGLKAYLEYGIQLNLITDKWPKEMW